MKENDFYLSTEIKYNCLDVVKMWGTDFELKVYSLTDTDYEVAENCIELYGDSRPDLYAFEVSLDDELSYDYMNDAITWYASHIGKPDMEILRTDPREDFLEGSLPKVGI
ncbi:hypothetical protein [Daejeonella lutea]|uniref:Uncharacterized protein n=1 Tax=Daejeonella lutea TaxID=572036 RepID=A0A1T4ZZI0_9SPHI|nr:hypothetical protein [Daejeonella lutea]SKB27927.1 hypothetical protein SAMN05661099_0105 [Daejeonella lutea]